MIDYERFTRVLTETARTLVTEYQVTEHLDRICEDINGVLNATGSGVMLGDEAGHLRFVAASDEVVHEIEALQIELGEGPCLHAYRTGERVVVPDLDATDAFPAFSPKALQLGMRAVFSFPMRAGGERIGAINLYRHETGEFDDEYSEVGQVLADVATVSILNSRAFEESSRLSSQLQHALDSRIVIEQAKGKLSEQLQLPVDASFARLRGYARRTGRRLHDVAREVVNGEIDPSVFRHEAGS